MTQIVLYKHPFFSQLPVSTRILFTMTLVTFGIGYIFALIYVVAMHAGRDGQSGLSVRDIEIAYAGSQATRLESALRGPMAPMLSRPEAEQIINWIHDGADEAAYHAAIAPIIGKRCIGCHSGKNQNIPKIVEFTDLRTLVATDEGASIVTLIRISHIHLFGLTFIFSITGFIFSHAYVKTRFLKSIVLALPFLAIFLDIASWFLTKVSPLFAYVVMGGGAIMAISFAFQWGLSLYQMWFLHAPPARSTPD